MHFTIMELCVFFIQRVDDATTIMEASNWLRNVRVKVKSQCRGEKKMGKGRAGFREIGTYTGSGNSSSRVHFRARNR